MSFSIYHCGHCGSLFPAEAGTDDDRVCGVCNHRPGTGEWPVENGQEDGGDETRPGPVESPASPPAGKVHRSMAKRRSATLLPWVVAVWVLLMALALWVHHRNSVLDLAAVDRAGIKAAMERERAAVLEAALPECHRSLMGFLTAVSKEKRSLHVADPLAAARKMADFYSSNAFPEVDPARLGRIGQEPLMLDGEWVVATRWQVGDDGERFDAVFRRESGAWVLDWDHFARFSPYPWELFLAGEGPDEGEFRLLAWQVQGGDKAERSERLFRFSLVSPEAGIREEALANAPVFEVGRHSEEGLLLAAAFAARKEGGGPFGGALEPMEPEGLVPVRVVVKRSDIGGVRKFEVVRIIACHWITGDAPGFDIGKLKDDPFGGN